MYNNKKACVMSRTALHGPKESDKEVDVIVFQKSIIFFNRNIYYSMYYYFFNGLSGELWKGPIVYQCCEKNKPNATLKAGDDLSGPVSQDHPLQMTKSLSNKLGTYSSKCRENYKTWVSHFESWMLGRTRSRKQSSAQRNLG